MADHVLIARIEDMPGLLDGTITQIRRVVKPQPVEDLEEDWLDGNLLSTYRVWDWHDRTFDEVHELDEYMLRRCPLGGHGDRLIVKESWACGIHDPETIIWRAMWPPGLEPNDLTPWRSAVTMPRWASRCWLEVVTVKVQRLDDITYGDCLDEGVDMSAIEYRPGWDPSPYIKWWDAHNPKYLWASNPWTWIGTVRRVMP